MIPEGTYLARATGTAEWGISNQGSEYLQVEYAIREGECSGQTITAWLYFTDKATKRAFESLRYSGCTFPDDDITNLEGLGSKDVKIVIEHEEYEGKTRAKVKWINSTALVVANPLGSGERESLKRRVKGTIVDAKRRTPSQTDAAPFDANEDLPF